MDQLHASVIQLGVAVGGAVGFFVCAHLLFLLAHRVLGRAISGTSRLFSRLDERLVDPVSVWLGLAETGFFARWGRMIAIYLGLAVIGAVAPIWLALPALFAGLVFVTAAFRRWSWDEEDRAAGLPPAERRIKGGEDYNDELLAALSAVFMFGALLTWRLGGALTLFDLPAHLSLIGYFSYVTGEAIKAVPVLGNFAETAGWANPSGLRTVAPWGGWFALALRTALDILVISGLLKAADIAGRIHRGDDLRKAEIGLQSRDEDRIKAAVALVRDRAARGHAPATELLGRIATVPAKGPAAFWRARWHAAEALHTLGMQEEGSTHLTMAIQGWRGLIDEARTSAGPMSLPSLLDRLGQSADRLGNRIGGQAGLVLLRDAERARREAFEIWEVDTPLKASAVQFALAATLLRIGQRETYSDAREALLESVTLHRKWLADRGPTASALNRAEACNNLGIALQRLAVGRPHDEARELLDESVDAFRAALDEPFDQPARRARFSNHLTISMERLARLPGSHVSDLEAVIKASEALLEAPDQTDPGRRASVLLSLAVPLQKLAQQLDNSDADGLLERSRKAAREAADLNKARGDREGYANALDVLGVTLDSAARRQSEDTARATWKEAVQAHRDARDIMLEAGLDADAARCSHNLMWAATGAGSNDASDKGLERLREAVRAGRGCRLVRTLEDAPADFALSSRMLGEALAGLAWRDDLDARRGLRREAIAAFEDGLKVYTAESDLNEWFNCRLGAAVNRRHLADLTPGPDGYAELTRAEAGHCEIVAQEAGLTEEQVRRNDLEFGVCLDKLAMALGWPIGQSRAEEAVFRLRRAVSRTDPARQRRDYLNGLFSLAFTSARLATRNPAWIDTPLLRLASEIYERRHAEEPDPNYPAERRWFDDWLARAGPDPDPAAPCPCGSQAPYADCHGQWTAARPD